MGGWGRGPTASPVPPDPLFSPSEARALVRRAGGVPPAASLQAEAVLPLSALQGLADPAALDLAAAELMAGARPPRTRWGAPDRLWHARTLEGPSTAARWTRLVQALETALGTPGATEHRGFERAWRGRCRVLDGPITVRVRPLGEDTRATAEARVSTLKPTGLVALLAFGALFLALSAFPLWTAAAAGAGALVLGIGARARLRARTAAVSEALKSALADAV